LGWGKLLKKDLTPKFNNFSDVLAEDREEVRIVKTVKSENYNYIFNPTNGLFARWGKTLEDDPEFSPLGPELMDIEISTVCHQGCPFCYKGNISRGENMSLETFKQLFSKFPSNLTQIAFGVGSIDSNQDTFEIMWHCRKNGIVPNITINGYRMMPELYDKLVGVCGAVAVSLYDADVCYNAVQELTKRGLKQVNIHAMLSEETYDKCLEVQKAKEEDDRLKDLNAIVYLRLKPKGRGQGFHQVSREHYHNLINRALERDIPIGFDSCSAPSFAEVIKDRKDYSRIMQYVEPCESACFSAYINVQGRAFPCSFTEGLEEYEGIDVLHTHNFLTDVWNSPEYLGFRKKLNGAKDKNGCRKCPAYNLD